jgi:tripartite-type tricarboxylate transporter receptor subunit TctC
LLFAQPRIVLREGDIRGQKARLSVLKSLDEAQNRTSASTAGPKREAAKMIKALLAAAVFIACALHGSDRVNAQEHAQDYPNRPIKVVVPFPPGGPTDGMARIISVRLGAVLGQPIVVESRGGAGGSVGGKFVASADPDGYTILLTPGGALTSGPAVHRDFGYDPVKAFVPICELIETPLIISVNPSVPVKSLADVVAYAKANPGKLNWGSQGVGVAPHLLYELFKLEAGVNIVHVPYRGTAPMLVAVLANEVQIVADPSTTSLPVIQAGKLRPIAIAGAARDPQLPDVPTVVEAGFPKLQAPFWLGVVAPAGTPAVIVDKLNAAFRQTMNDPQTRKQLDDLGAYVKIGTPEDFRQMLAAELALWTDVVRAANIQME